MPVVQKSTPPLSTLAVVTGQIRRLIYRAQFYLDIPSLVQLLKFRQLRVRYYQELWQNAAGKIDATCSAWDFGFTRISRNGTTTMVSQSNVMLDDHLTLEIMGNKALVYSLMSDLGYAVPDHRRFSIADFAVCKDFFKTVNRPVVIKPASGTGGGRGVTTGITTLPALRKAFRLAARFDSSLIVEEQLEGHSYRLTYINGAFVDAVRRDPPTITGDGRHTIRQLVRKENVGRLAGNPVTALSPLKIDRDCQNLLQEQGLSPRHRLDSGQVIVLKRAINENDRNQNHRVRDQVHPDTISAGSVLVRKLGLKFAGLDVIAKDIANPLSPDNGLIGEINTTPGIHHHYLVAEESGKADIAERLLEFMFRSGQGVMDLERSRRISSISAASVPAKAQNVFAISRVC